MLSGCMQGVYGFVYWYVLTSVKWQSARGLVYTMQVYMCMELRGVMQFNLSYAKAPLLLLLPSQIQPTSTSQSSPCPTEFGMLIGQYLSCSLSVSARYDSTSFTQLKGFSNLVAFNCLDQ